MRGSGLKAVAAAIAAVFVVSFTSVFGTGSSAVTADTGKILTAGTVIYPGDTVYLTGSTYMFLNDAMDVCWIMRPDGYLFADSFTWDREYQRYSLRFLSVSDYSYREDFILGYGYATEDDVPSAIMCTSGDGLSRNTAFAFELVTTMYRLYNPNSGEHFYTSNVGERNNLISLGWNDEGIGWYAPAHSNTPVYRLYNPNAGEHHYTTDVAERENLISLGWNDEGIGWYSDDSRRVPLYRQYNPNEFANNHNYTTSLAENNWLVSLGWQAEDIGWYGVG